MRYAFIIPGLREHRLLREGPEQGTAPDSTPQVEANEPTPEAPKTSKEANNSAINRAKERLAKAEKKTDEFKKMNVADQMAMFKEKVRVAKLQENPEEAVQAVIEEASQPGSKVAIDAETHEVIPIKPGEGEKPLGEQMRVANRDIAKLEELMEREGDNPEIKEEIAALKQQVEKLQKRQGNMTIGEKLTDDLKSGLAILGDKKATIWEKLGGIMAAFGAVMSFIPNMFNLGKRYGGEASSSGPKGAPDILKDIADGNLMGKDVLIAGHTFKVSDAGATIDGKKITVTMPNPWENKTSQILLTSIEKKGGQLILNNIAFGIQDILAFVQAMEEKGTYLKNMITISVEGGALGKPKEDAAPQNPEQNPKASQEAEQATEKKNAHLPDGDLMSKSAHLDVNGKDTKIDFSEGSIYVNDAKYIVEQDGFAWTSRFTIQGAQKQGESIILQIAGNKKNAPLTNVVINEKELLNSLAAGKFHYDPATKMRLRKV